VWGVWGVGGVGVWGHSLRSTFHRLHLLRLWTPTILMTPQEEAEQEQEQEQSKMLTQVSQSDNVGKNGSLRPEKSIKQQ
jgi:hypothetical protein